jgi:hypothetical protein
VLPISHCRFTCAQHWLLDFEPSSLAKYVTRAGSRKMKNKFLGVAFGLAALAASTAASAHVDIGVGIGFPVGVYAPAEPAYAPPPPVVYAAPPPVVYGPPPVAVAYGDDDDRRTREWRERHEWREGEWRRHEWREHEWRERHGWRGY